MRAVLCGLLACALALPPPPAFPGDREGASPSPEAPAASPAERILPEQQEAIDRGLAWLAARQAESGAFPARPAGNEMQDSAQYQTAVTALATLAFLGAGHGLRHGPYRDRIARAVDWLLRAQENCEVQGYISFRGDNQSRMHGHGFATLALAEAYGTAASPGETEVEPRNAAEREIRELSRRLRRGIQEAVDLIEASQSLTGGWDYTPASGGKSDHEGSVTVCQVQALLAAGNRGFRVSLPRIQKAREYMRRSQVPSGGFKYKLSQEDGGPRGADSHSWALTAAGVVSLLGLAEYDRKDALERGYQYMDRKGLPHPERTPYFFYGSFYAVQAYRWAGGDRWARFWMPVRSRLLDMQEDDGSWTGRDTSLDLGDVYPTSMVLLMLEVPVGYLSIYAR